MTSNLLLAVALSGALLGQAGELPAPSGDAGIVPPGARLELIYTRTAPISGGLTEGPAVAPDGSIYFSDIPLGADKGLIVRYEPRSGATSVFAGDSHKSNGLIFDREGFLLACEGADYGGRGVARWNVATGERTVVVDRYHGKRFNAPNDLCVDRQGRIYFTDPRYLGAEPRELERRAVYRIDLDGQVSELTHDVAKPNGIAISPDQKTLYVADTDNGTDRIDPDAPPPKQGVMAVHAFPLDEGGRIAGPRRTIIDFGDEKGCDGMTVDREGNLYLSVRSARRPGVMVATREGRELAFIPTGAADQTPGKEVGLPSNVEFGLGEESNVLYVTVDKCLYCIRLASRGFHHQYEP